MGFLLKIENWGSDVDKVFVVDITRQYSIFNRHFLGAIE